MSLQAVINPLEFMKKKTGFDGSRTLGEVERERTNTAITPGMIDSFSPRPGRGMGHLNLTEEQKAKMLAPLLKRPDLDGSGPGMITAREARENQMGQGIPNMGGFDPGDLMARPEIRQEETRNQANMVSAPYEQANRMAAEKTNPMNAESQNPGRVFLMKFIGKE